jgi:glycosyltransferase involved in cell wall biosynthesis
MAANARGSVRDMRSSTAESDSSQCVLFLHSHLSGYFLRCLEALRALTNASIHVVSKGVAGDAPFEVGLPSGIRQYDRFALDAAGLQALADALNPVAIFVSGWTDLSYLRVARDARRRGVPVVCCSDSAWEGRLRQRLLAATRRLHMRKLFSHMWVAGQPQYGYARILGFAASETRTGVYSGDVELFARAYRGAREHKRTAYPKTLLYVGRLAVEKGVRELHAAFRSIPEIARNGWTLRMVGNGPLRDELTAFPGFQLESFRQPWELPELAIAAGAFILPSSREPWGVVVHEFAAAGLPLICSDAVGAATAFLIPKHNGFLFSRGESAQLREALLQLMACTDAELNTMSERSHSLSRRQTPDLWAATAASTW